MDLKQIEDDLVGEVGLSRLQAKVFLLVTTRGKMNSFKIAEELAIGSDEALDAAKSLVDLGGFIDITATDFEAMHPRFTAVNMYRRMCTRKNIQFKKNLTVDNIGVALERHYDHARTK
jgi:hypothetical protein